MKKNKLELIVFLSGAIGMGLELIAARVLSPYVGSSNVVWTSIIGIILVSMSFGYYIGGKLADKKADLNALANILLLAALTTSFIPILETIVVKNLAGMINNLIIAAIICAIIVFSIHSFILAMVSPFAVKIKSDQEKEIGTVSGRISSISTIGSIVGTFLMGFVLIPRIGVSNINIGVTLLIIIMSLVARNQYTKKEVWVTILLICVMGITSIIGKFIFKLNNPDILLDTDSQYSRIWVKQIATKTNKYKTLQVDTGLESYIDSDGNMGAEYLKYYDLFEYFNKDANSTLLIGGAAYTYPIHYLQKYQNKKIDVVEIDNKMTEIAEDEFGLDSSNPNLSIYDQDGRSYLNYTNKKYDVILLDAFKGVNAPFELTTYEALNNAKNALNENGIVLTNIISSLEGEQSDFIKYEYATYKAVFDDVKVFAVRDRENTELRQNVILVGIKGNPKIDEGKYSEYENYLNMEIKNFETDKKIVTDDFAPIGN